MMRATFWQTQLSDGTRMRGGQQNLFSDDLNVAAVPVDLLKTFTIAHNTYCYTYFAPLRTWYKDGKAVPFTYPAVFTLADGSQLTIDEDGGTNVLNLNQNY
ncbi:hypothetical protein [Brevibacillus borstelensis]